MLEKPKRSLQWLLDAAFEDNIARDLTEPELGRLGVDVVRSFELDKRARSGWDRQSEAALKLAKQVKEAKSFPWQDASNVKHPLITVACIQFAARAYPEIVKGNQVVKCVITGDDNKQAGAGLGGGQAQLAAAAQMGVSPPYLSQPPMPVPSGSENPASGVAPGFAAGLPGQTESLGTTGPEGVVGLGGGNGGMPSAGIASMLSNTLAPGAEAPSLVPGVVGPQSTSPKADRARRIEVHMNYQLTQEMPEWDQDMDMLLHVLPVLGQCYKKVYRNSVERRSVCELVLPQDCYISAEARTIEKARRVTQVLYLYENDVIEKCRSGLWLEPTSLTRSLEVNPDDSDPVFEFLEQHRWEDLDGDGYKEPYIVTVHKPTQQVVRVVARWQAGAVDIETDKAKPRVVRIAPDQYFVHYSFIPNSDGSMNSLGFGQLLEPINASVNTVLNQLIDAGTLHNTGGGFIGRGVRLRGGQWSFSPNEWKVVDAPGGALKENIIPLPTREPSQVLFNLLGFLVQAGKDISSVQDVLIGRERITGDMPVGTTMALVEQGLKVFTAIYKRVYRSLTVEFKKLYKLNALYLDPQFTFYLAGQDDKYVVGQRDYEYDDLTVLPVADPNLSSDMQRLLKAQALKDLSGRPGLNEVEVTRRLVKAIQPDNIDKILLSDAQIAGKEPVPWTPPPPPQAVVAQAKAQRLVQQAKESDIRLKMDIMRLQLELAELRAKIGKLKAEAIDKIASAEAREAGQQIDAYRAEIERLATELDARAQAFGQMAQGQGQGQEQIARDEAGGFGLGLDAVSEPQLTDSSRSPRQPAGPVGLDGFGLGLGSPEGAAPRRPVMGRPPKIPMEGASLSVPPEGIPRRLAAPMQEGGPVVQGQPYLVGEAGPEAFVPKSFARDPLYDYESALAYGLKPDETAHWPSRIPGGQHEGLLLKAENHPTFNLTVEAERVLGNSIYKDVDSGRLYSFPADRPVSGRLRRYEPRLGQ